MRRKQPRVPETRQPTPNREQRRHPERAEDAALSRDEAARRALPPDHEAPPKRHKKKTAENWNQ